LSRPNPLRLDAYYARLYGLTRDDLRYTPCGVDPKEVHGDDSRGETFHVLKEKEVRLYGDVGWIKKDEG
jgi:hypothetical protein